MQYKKEQGDKRSCEREWGADRAAEDPEFGLGELWQSLGPGGGEDLWEAWVGDFQRARYVQPDWWYLVVACRTATRRAKQSNAKPNQRRGSGHVSAPRGQHNMQGDDGGADNLSCRHPLE
jgi:hypothetical protein